MSNEFIFILSALVDIVFIFLAARRGAEWLLGTVITNLILVGIFGSKLITLFGFTTNAGNVFYACVFLATYFILEQSSRKLGMRTVWYGVVFALFFTLMSQLATKLVGLSMSVAVNESITNLFSFFPRVALAAIVAYVFAQYVNISVYEWLRAKTRGRFLLLRSNGANIVAQLVDSLLFFSIAFFDLPGPVLVQTILVGWAIKSAVVALGSPLLCLDARIRQKKT